MSYKKNTAATMAGVEVINVRLPGEVISMLDKLVEKKMFNSRSEAVREFAREYVLQQRK